MILLSKNTVIMLVYMKYYQLIDYKKKKAINFIKIVYVSIYKVYYTDIKRIPQRFPSLNTNLIIIKVLLIIDLTYRFHRPYRRQELARR